MYQFTNQGVDCYLVGGAVRDELLDIPVYDQDYVVTGATPELLLELGFKQVGNDFPVFLDPKTHNEYALARTERKQGVGYSGFSCQFSPDITLEEDLSRRDLTINAIAKASDGRLIDPHNGLMDLQNKILRHVSEAFIEDPLRVLRIARFAAKFPEFSIAPETLNLMLQIASSGELQFLTAERVWLELEKALQTDKPSNFFNVLRQANAIEGLFPELHAMINIPQRADYHAEGDVWQHTMMVLDTAAAIATAENLMFEDRTAMLAAALWHDVGKAVTPHHLLWNPDGTMRGKHTGHESAKVVSPILKSVFARIPLPKALKTIIYDVAVYHIRVHCIADMKAATVVRFFQNAGFHNKGGSKYLTLLTLACKADSLGRLLSVDGEIKKVESNYSQQQTVLKYFEAIRKVNIGRWIAEFKLAQGIAPSVEQIQEQKQQLEISAITQVMQELKNKTML